MGDIDKIIEDLEKQAHYFEDECTDQKRANVCYNAIQTIRKLQNKENGVCEWERSSSGYVGIPAFYSKCCTTHSNGLEMGSNIIKDWKCCPYCGRKIKVVE